MVNFPKILSHQLPSPGRGARPGGQRLLRLRATGRAAAASASAAGGGTRSVLEGLKIPPVGDGSKPWYLVNPKIAGKWMFIPLKMYL